MFRTIRIFYKYAAFIIVPLCIIFGAWGCENDTQVQRGNNTQAQEEPHFSILEKGYDTIKLNEKLSLRVDLVRVVDALLNDGSIFNGTCVQYFVEDRNGNSYNFTDIGVGLFLRDPRDEEVSPFLAGGSCLLQVDDTVILCITETDCAGIPSDNAESTRRIVTNAEQYQDVAVARIDIESRNNEVCYLIGGLGVMQIFVLDEVPEDYFLDCGRNTLTAEDIAELIQYIDS